MGKGKQEKKCISSRNGEKGRKIMEEKQSDNKFNHGGEKSKGCTESPKYETEFIVKKKSSKAMEIIHIH